MPLDYRADPDARIARITGSGDVTYEDCMALLELQRRDLALELHLLMDYRDARMRMSVPQSAELAQLNSALYEGRYVPISAVVSAPGLGFGMARAFESNLEESDFYRIFTDVDEAEAWLRARIAELGAAD